MASELLLKVLQAHGGLERWNSFDNVQATIITGGELFGMKGTPQDATPRRMTVAARREWASVRPYGADDQRTGFTPNRIAIEKFDSTVVKERLQPAKRSDDLLRCHDCHVDASGGFAAAQYVFEPVKLQGITFPARRRAYMRNQSLFPIRDRLMVSIDISEISLL